MDRILATKKKQEKEIDELENALSAAKSRYIQLCEHELRIRTRISMYKYKVYIRRPDTKKFMPITSTPYPVLTDEIKKEAVSLLPRDYSYYVLFELFDDEDFKIHCT